MRKECYKYFIILQSIFVEVLVLANDGDCATAMLLSKLLDDDTLSKALTGYLSIPAAEVGATYTCNHSG